MAEWSNAGVPGAMVARNGGGAGRNGSVRRSKKRTPQVYFIANGGRIKVGYSAQVEKRIADIAGYVGDVEVIGVMDGTQQVERSLHAHFQAHHLTREWFQDCEQLRRQIANILAVGWEAAGVNLLPKSEPPAPFVPGPGRPPRELRREVMKMMWGDEAIDELASMAGVPTETARIWFDGAEEMPLLVRLAFSTVAMTWIWEQPLKSFKRGEWE